MQNGMGVGWALFDLNGTVLDPSGIAGPLGGSDADRRLVAEAFHQALLLTMADTLSGGGYRPLPEYLRATLERALRAEGRDREVLHAAMRRAATLEPFADAGAALSRLRAADIRLGVLTNSTTETAERAPRFERGSAVAGADPESSRCRNPLAERQRDQRGLAGSRRSSNAREIPVPGGLLLPRMPRLLGAWPTASGSSSSVRGVVC